jgi:orotate phosphoribosyltransferase
MGLPIVYIRSEAKKHGLTNMIEGELTSGQNVVVIEDLISTAGSSLKAVEALREKGANVKGMVAIFTYGFDVANEKLKEANCITNSLCDYNTLIEVALKHEYINESDLESLKKWRENPSVWKQ